MEVLWTCRKRSHLQIFTPLTHIDTYHLQSFAKEVSIFHTHITLTGLNTKLTAKGISISFYDLGWS